MENLKVDFEITITMEDFMKPATIEKTEKRSYVIQFPESYPITKEKLKELIYRNPDYVMEVNGNRCRCWNSRMPIL
jgi:hypothetical protein